MDPLKERKNQLGLYSYILRVNFTTAAGGRLTGNATDEIIVSGEEPQSLDQLRAIAKDKARNYRLPIITWQGTTLYRWTQD